MSTINVQMILTRVVVSLISLPKGQQSAQSNSLRVVDLFGPFFTNDSSLKDGNQ